VPAAVVLDLPRPGSSGCDLCKKIADLIPGLPLVILSGSSDVADKVLLLKMGADDYVTIPFSPRELVARLRALMRRASRVSPEDANVYVFADVMMDFAKTEITRGGEKITVTPKEYKTLEFLAKNAQRVISRDELLNEVWGYRNWSWPPARDGRPICSDAPACCKRPLRGRPPSHRLQICTESKQFLTFNDSPSNTVKSTLDPR
jgi:DNA-binding response OmpR family regulator